MYDLSLDLYPSTKKYTIEEGINLIRKAITPLGESAIELWDGIKSKKCGIDEITLIDTSNFKTKLAGEVKNYDYLKYFTADSNMRMSYSPGTFL